MNITIVGHGHLAYITAACMEQFHRVNVDETSYKLSESDVVWICHDTPVDADGQPCTDAILSKLDDIAPRIPQRAEVLISSQTPVGTCALMRDKYPVLRISYSPENLRRGKAINDFMNPERIIVGTGNDLSKPALERLFAPLNTPIFWTNTESAEMIKHALNSYLAVSIAFINEIDRVAKRVGANSDDVAYGLQSDKRIGFLSYLKPGGPYTNDTLGREIHTLIELDNRLNLGLTLIPATKKSNDEHRNNRG